MDSSVAEIDWVVMTSVMEEEEEPDGEGISIFAPNAVRGTRYGPDCRILCTSSLHYTNPEVQKYIFILARLLPNAFPSNA